MNLFIIAFVYVLSNGQLEANAEPCGLTLEECVKWQAKTEAAMKADKRILGYAFGVPQEVFLEPKKGEKV